MVNTSKRLLELDSLRGIAAIMVVLFHVTGGIYLFQLGMMGVELFFLISGFVIFMTLEKIKSSKDFIISRVIRLYPAYWICVSLTALIIVVSIGAGKGFGFQYLTNMTMFQIYFRQGDIDGSYWTLSIEMMFYIFMLVIYNIKSLHRLELIGSIALFPILLYGAYFSYHVPLLENRVFRFVGLVNFFPLFLSGIVYYNLKFHSKTVVRLIILLACYLVQLTLFHTVYFRVLSNISMWEYSSVLALFYGIFLLYVYDKLKFIVNPVTVFLGNISYPLYLIHQYVSTHILMPFFLSHINFWPAVLIDLLIVIVIAYVINNYIEKPISKLMRNKLLTPASKRQPLKSLLNEPM
jgi:peptidoglycan/LPS O-acetylase OafA/YrhL